LTPGAASSRHLLSVITACGMFQTYSEQQDPLFSSASRRIMRRAP
jgi:hypothetical protein